jgi:hypothetical protein
MLAAFIVPVIFRFQNLLTKDDLVVNAHADDEERKSEKLEGVEYLPTNGKGHCPDHQCSDGVKYHSGTRKFFLIKCFPTP